MPRRTLNRRCGALILAPAFERLRHRDFVGPLEVGADGNAHRDPRHADAEGLQDAREIDRGGLALHGGAGGEDHLLDATRADTREQAVDLELVRSDALQPGEAATL